MTYDDIAIEPGTNDLIVSGLRLHPQLDWDQKGQCTIGIDRAVIADSNSIDSMRTNIELSGLAVPPACFQPEVAAAWTALAMTG